MAGLPQGMIFFEKPVRRGPSGVGRWKDADDCRVGSLPLGLVSWKDAQQWRLMGPGGSP